MTYDVIIIGGGPAGLTAAIYGKRAGLSTLMIESSAINGGQILSTYEVDNYPGLPKIAGMELGNKFQEHAKELGATFVTDTVLSIEGDKQEKLVVTEKETYHARTVIITTGAVHSQLRVPGEEQLSGMGVSYCATCDGAFFRGREVAVVGGGDVALEDALFLARGCSKVYLIHRRDEFRGARILQKQIEETENIEIIYDTIVKEIQGEDMVENLLIYNKKTQEEKKLPVSGIFIAVGIVPNTEGIQGLPKQDEKGYIVAGEDCITSIPGIFAAGDVRTKPLRQVITACADGANAITSIEAYLHNIM